MEWHFLIDNQLAAAPGARHQNVMTSAAVRVAYTKPLQCGDVDRKEFLG
jgi:hypothetical protein